jgi:hypothetical protein
MAEGAARPAVDLEFVDPTAEEQHAFKAVVTAHMAEIRAAPLTKHAMEVALAEHQWLHDHTAIRNSPDAAVRDAIAVILRGSIFIGGKLARTLYRADGVEERDDDPIQNDRNGSAKIALIVIERSESAWLTIAQATGNVGAADIASALSALRDEVEAAYPCARRFKRPGFDQP